MRTALLVGASGISVQVVTSFSERISVKSRGVAVHVVPRIVLKLAWRRSDGTCPDSDFTRSTILPEFFLEPISPIEVRALRASNSFGPQRAKTSPNKGVRAVCRPVQPSLPIQPPATASKQHAAQTDVA